MGGVSPEVVVAVADPRDVGNLLPRVEDREQAGLEILEVIACGERCHRLGVAGLHPVELLLTSHLLEPEVGISGLGGDVGGRGDGHCDPDESERHAAPKTDE